MVKGASLSITRSWTCNYKKKKIRNAANILRMDFETNTLLVKTITELEFRIFDTRILIELSNCKH